MRLTMSMPMSHPSRHMPLVNKIFSRTHKQVRSVPNTHELGKLRLLHVPRKVR